MDCELVGIAPDAAAPAGYRFLSFQELSSRPRGEVAGPECAVAVALFNPTPNATALAIAPADLGLGAAATARDLWSCLVGFL